ncbi:MULTISPECIES: AAA family ATPase [unclassified Microcystis]|nr:AAA family ATPase [Microcystis sp. M065S2]
MDKGGKRSPKKVESPSNTPDVSASKKSHKYSGYFDSLIKKQSQDFIGRVYVFNAISQFINSRESGYFLVTGDPGMGKSSILAQWVIDNQCIAYFNVKKERDKASEFVENIIEQLNLRHNIKADFNDNRNEYSNLLLSALEKASQESKEKIVIVIDALDEVDPYSCQGANILFLSANLPKNVFIIMSERRDTPAQLSGKHLANESLSLLDSKYEADTNQDIRDYVRAKINKTETLRKQIEIIANSINEFIDVITEKSEKNFLYLRYMLPNIEEGVYQSITKLDSLPKGLQDYYEKHWERMGMMSSPLPKTKLYVIYHLSESYRAISREQVAKYIGETNITVQEILDEWLQFLHKQNIKDEICYKIYHQSFQDFLNRIDIIQAAGIDLKEINKQKTRILNKIWRNLRDSK